MAKPNSTQAALNTQKEVSELSTIFSSKHFCALIEVTGEDAQGNSYRHSFIMDNKDPEFRAMINDYGARKSVELLNVPNVNLGI